LSFKKHHNEKKIFSQILFWGILFISMGNFQCKKNNVDSFCEIQRADYLQVNNKEGMVVYSYKYNRYAIDLTVINSNNIDSEVIGFVCNLDPEFQNVGLKVIVTGNLKYFNNEENMTPEIAGQNLYFFNLSTIIKK
jgi:calcineurin-like phosphoesterase